MYRSLELETLRVSVTILFGFYHNTNRTTDTNGVTVQAGFGFWSDFHFAYIICVYK